MSKLNGTTRWIGLFIILAGMIFAFGSKSKALEKDTEANKTAIAVVREAHEKDMRVLREDVKEIKTDVKKLLSRP